jgi:PAS domain S-box-containing protein
VEGAVEKEVIHVLLVDDEDHYVLIRDMIAAAGGARFQLDWVDTKDDALAHIAARGHHVCLVASRFRGGRGLDLLSEAIDGGCQTPFILLAGPEDLDLDSAAMGAGAAAFLDKATLSPQLLVRTVRNALARTDWQKTSLPDAIDLRLINLLNTAANRGDSLDDIFAMLADETGRIFGGTGAAVFLLSPDRQHLHLRAAFFPQSLLSPLLKLVGILIPDIYEFTLRPDGWYAGILRDGKSVIISDTVTIERVIEDTIDLPAYRKYAPQIRKLLSVRSMVACPLGYGDGAVGVLDIVRSTPFTAEDQRRIEAIAEHVLAIIKRQHAEADLCQSERRARALLDATSDSVAMLDKQCRFVDLNAAMARRWDAEPHELLGVCAYDLLSPELAESRRQRLERVMRTGEPAVFEDERGEYVFQNSVYPVLDESGGVVQLAVFARDITALKEAEAQQERLRAKLLASQRMEAVGQLSAGIAHDFNNLLTAINGFAELLLLQCAGHDDAQQMLESILHAGQRASRLVQQLLAFSQRQMTFPQPVDLSQMLLEEEDAIRQTAGTKVKVAVVPASGLWLVKADPEQIKQMLQMLTANARDSMPAGGHLILETSNTQLTEDEVADQPEAAPGDYVQLRASDTGVGFNDEARDRLFEPFYFTSPEVADERGLRLAALFGIVKQNAGHIWVDSREGRGAVFRIYLPRHKEQ